MSIFKIDKIENIKINDNQNDPIIDNLKEDCNEKNVKKVIASNLSAALAEAQAAPGDAHDSDGKCKAAGALPSAMDEDPSAKEPSDALAEAQAAPGDAPDSDGMCKAEH